MRIIALILSIIFLSSSLSHGAEIKMLKNNVIRDGNVALSNCIYLNRGPEKPYDKKSPINEYIPESYRVSFSLFEIYYNIDIEKIKAPTEEGRMPTITESYNINGIELAEKINLEEKGEVITDIKFIKWNSWDSFVLKIHGKTVKFKILENSKLELTVL